MNFFAFLWKVLERQHHHPLKNLSCFFKFFTLSALSTPTTFGLPIHFILQIVAIVVLFRKIPFSTQRFTELKLRASECQEYPPHLPFTWLLTFFLSLGQKPEQRHFLNGQFYMNFRGLEIKNKTKNMSCFSNGSLCSWCKKGPTFFVVRGWVRRIFSPVTYSPRSESYTLHGTHRQQWSFSSIN